jgi:hypothetical protein
MGVGMLRVVSGLNHLVTNEQLRTPPLLGRLQIPLTPPPEYATLATSPLANSPPHPRAHARTHPPDVPDLAMVPKFLTSSSLVMPTPRSRMNSWRLALSAQILMSSLAVSPSPRTALSAVSEKENQHSTCR